MEIGAQYSGNTFVKYGWVNILSGLFEDLHTENTSQHQNTISKDEFLLIKRILEMCCSKKYEVTLSTSPLKQLECGLAETNDLISILNQTSDSTIIK